MKGTTGRCVIAVGSLSFAMKGQRLLGDQSIASSVVRLHPSRTKRGCAYGIELDCADVRKATDLLSGSGIRYSEVIPADGEGF